MQLLVPELLWAFGLLGIPIAIHLFNFQRPKRIIFSNLRFLKAVYQQDQAARTIKHYLVLASRLLFLALLIMAFVQPQFSDTQSTGTGRFTSIYIDNSPSMGRYEGQSTALDIAISTAEQVVGKASSAQQYHILSNDFANLGQYFFSITKAQEQLRGIQLTSNFRDALAILKKQKAAYEAEATNGQKPHLIWLSDFQKSTLGSLSELASDTSIAITLVPIRPQASSNLYIDTVYTDTPFLQAGQKTTLYATIKNAGTKAVEGVTVKLLIDGAQIATAAVSVPANGEGKAKFDFVTAKATLSKAKLEIQDPEVTYDNEYYLVFRPAPKVNVCLITQAGNRYLESVFANENLFNTSSYPVGNIDFETLASANLVVLEGVENELPKIGQQLAKVVASAGSVLIIPSEKANLSAFNQQLNQLGISIGLESPTTDTSKSNLGNQLKLPQADDPFMAGVFEELARNTILPYARNTIKINGGRTVLRLENGNSLLSQFIKGKGTYYILSSSLSSKQTNLPTQGLFVPIMLRLALLSLPNQQALSYSLQSPLIELGLDVKRSDNPVKLIGERTVIPGQQRMSGKLILELPKGELSSGYYNITHGDSTLGVIALNIGHAESQLDTYSDQELQELAKTAKNISIANSPTAINQDTISTVEQSGLPLWYILLMMAVVAYGLEVLILRFFK